jgi:hypothetical protein
MAKISLAKKIILPATIVLQTSCSPSVYLIDRQTVLELEASGDWKELDETFHKQEMAAGPIPTEKTREKVERRQVFNMTHADTNSSVVPDNSKK